jgi:hypothetical protein
MNNKSSRTDVANGTYGVYYGTVNINGSISNNTIKNLTASNATLPARVIGINMDVTSASTATICSNNMITLGNSNPGLVYGILQNTGLGKVYHNTVYLAGSPAEGTFESSALNVTGTTVGREFLNNVLYNSRSNTGTSTGKHYIVKLNATTDLSSNYNVVNFTGTGGIAGAVGATDYATGGDWVTGTGLDTNSRMTEINFTNAAVGDLTLAGTTVKDFDLRVPYLATVTKDFLNADRNTKFTYAGAHQAALPFIYKSMKDIYKVGNGATDDFATLGEAINAVNDAIAIDGNIFFEITSDITEPANFGLGKNLNGNGLTIRPDADADRTITFTQATGNVGPWGHFVIGCATGNLNTALADGTVVPTNNVTIDGFAVGGDTKRLKLTTSTDALAGSVIINVVGGSANTTIKNSIIENQATGSNPRCIYITQFKGATVDAAPSNI